MLKDEKIFYKPSIVPGEILIPPMTFIELSGAGRPDAPEYAEVIGTLYGLAYTVRMAPRNGLTIAGYEEFAVYPLEGIWDLSEEAQKAADPDTFGVADKSQLVYRMMIRQPDFVTAEIWPEVLAQAARKKKLPLLDQVRLLRLEEGLCVQMMHVGPYDNEPASFNAMKDYCAKRGLQRLGHRHREIYISDPRRTAPDSLRTVLRWTVDRI